MTDRKCRKRRYLDEATAATMLAEIKRSGNKRFKEVKRSYLCHICGAWHLTKKPLREYKNDNNA